MIKDIIKGAIIGVANIIPGVSGGTMAVSMGIYDKLIFSITNLRKDLKNSIKFLLPILIGAVISIAALSFVITWLFANYPLQTNFTFIGLIVGGLPAILKKVKGTPGKKISIGTILPLILFFALVVGMACMGETTGADADISFSFVNFFVLFGIGVIAAATMVIPGVSGSMILMLLGYYAPVIAAIKNFFKSLAGFDMKGIMTGVGILLPFGLGCIIGIIVIAKLIEMVFEKWPLVAYFAIIGLIVASPFAILIMQDLTGKITVLSVIASVIMFCVGGVIAFKLGED